MALVFEGKPTATIAAKYTDEDKSINIDGCNAAETSVQNAATQINKLLAVVTRSVLADKNMAMTIKKGAVDDE